MASISPVVRQKSENIQHYLKYTGSTVKLVWFLFLLRGCSLAIPHPMGLNIQKLAEFSLGWLPYLG